jgi:predicted transcriptional regulator
VLTHLRVRLPATDHAEFSKIAEAGGTTASELLQQAIAPYIDGAKRLRPEPPEMKSTNYVIDQQIKERLEQLAATEGMPLEIAIRIVVREYLAGREN